MGSLVKEGPAQACLRCCLLSQALLAHTYNPSYSGGRDQEDLGWKAALANS
jgi:hypothetical protein